GSNCNAYRLNRELVVGIRNVQSYAERALCRECCSVAGTSSSRWTTCTLPRYRVRSRTTSWCSVARDWLAGGGCSAATIVNYRLPCYTNIDRLNGEFAVSICNVERDSLGTLGREGHRVGVACCTRRSACALPCNRVWSRTASR